MEHLDSDKLSDVQAIPLEEPLHTTAVETQTEPAVQ